MKVAASRPTTSILPSVEASKIPQAVRTARHSRATAACMSRRRAGSSAPASRARRPRTPRPRLGPAVNRRVCAPGRTAAARRPAKRAEGHRRIGHAEGRQPDLRHRPAERPRDDPEGVHVRGLALVGRHAGGGVALDVLDRAEALAERRGHVLGGDIVLPVDEGLRPGVRRRRGRAPRRRPRQRWRCRAHGTPADRRRGAAGPAPRPPPPPCTAVGEHAASAKMPRQAPALRGAPAPPPARSLERLAPGERAARLREAGARSA